MTFAIAIVLKLPFDHTDDALVVHALNSLPKYLTFYNSILFSHLKVGLINALLFFLNDLIPNVGKKATLHCRIFIQHFFRGILLCLRILVKFSTFLLVRTFYDYQEFYFGTKKNIFVFFCLFWWATHVGFSIWRPMLDSVFIIMSCTRQTQQYLACWE